MEQRVWVRSLAILMMGLLVVGTNAVSLGVRITTFAQQPQPTATLDDEGCFAWGSAFVAVKVGKTQGAAVYFAEETGMDTA
jgi:hypothetical protein